MKVEERAIPDSTDIMLDVIFEEEDTDMYESLIQMAKAEGKTAQEVIEEIIHSAPKKFFEG